MGDKPEMHANHDTPAPGASDASEVTQGPHALEELLENTGQAVMIIQEASIVYSNALARQMIGLDCSSDVNSKILDFILPDDRELLQTRFTECLEGHTGLTNDFNCRFLTSKGEAGWAKIQTHASTWQNSPALLIFLESLGSGSNKEKREAAKKPGADCDKISCDDFLVRLGKDGIILDFTLPCCDPLFNDLKIQRGDHLAGTGLPTDIVMLLGRMVDKTLFKGETQSAYFSFKEPNELLHYEARFHAVTPSEAACIIRNVTAGKRNEDSLTAINKAMLSFGPDPVENIQQMTELAGRMLGADMCFLHTLSGRDLDMTGEWNLPPDIDFPQAFLPFPCEDADSDCLKHDIVVYHCFEEEGACPPDFERLGIQTSVHHALLVQGECQGCITLLFRRYYQPGEYDKETLTLACASIAVEEERRRADEHLRESEDRFRETVDLLPELVFETDRHGRIGLVNQRAYQLLGKDANGEGPQGRFLADFIKDDQRERFLLGLNRAVVEETSVSGDYEILSADGTTVSCLLRLAPVRREGRVVGLRGLLIDLTEQKTTEEALRQSRLRHRSLVHDLPIGLYETTADGQLLHCNQALADALGYENIESLKGCDVKTFYVQPEERAEWVRQLEEKGRAEISELLLRRADGSTCWFRDSAVRVMGDKDSPVHYRGFLEDITDRKLAEERLHQSETRLRLLVDNARDLLVLFDRDASIAFCNAPQEYPFDATAAVGKHFTDLLDHPGMHLIEMRVGQVLDTGRPLSAETEFVVNGQSFWLGEEYAPARDSSGAMTGVALVGRNVTERHRAEEERAKISARMENVQRLESLAALAGGVAHNFNNLLQAILGNAELARTNLDKESPLYRKLDAIEEAAQRAARLSEQMLGFSGQSMHNVERMDVSRVLREMEDLLSTALAPHVKLEYDLADDLPPVALNIRHLRQVMVNLITNASESYEDKRGVVRVRTRFANRLPDAHSDVLEPPLISGQWVCIEVADDGCGMDEETRRKMFDPFFSTKFTGRGLGMAAVHGIVRAHEGALLVESEPGKGACIRIYLPATSNITRPRSLFARDESQRGHLNILVVDDEPEVLKVACEMLLGMGFAVQGTQDGEEGLRMIREKSQTPVDCVVLDMIMPSTPGFEVFQSIKKFRPDLPIIISTGHDYAWVVDHLNGRRPEGYVQKPFASSALLNEIESVLEL